VAEDERLAALAIEDVLTEFGHDVLLAEDGQAALDLAASHSFDVLVTDLAMPRMTGWELIPAIRALQPDLPVVVMTGYLPPGGATVLAAHAPAPLAILKKPFEVGELLAVLARISPEAEAPARAKAALAMAAGRE
jgi:CheY-like chemotaxis protein